MGVYRYFQNNPTGRHTGDCAIRAVSVALDCDWEKAFALLSTNAFLMGDLPNDKTVIGSVLRQNGFRRESIPHECPDCYTVEEFALSHPKGIFVIISDQHIATIKDGLLYDAWDSSDEIPQYYWAKVEE